MPLSRTKRDIQQVLLNCTPGKTPLTSLKCFCSALGRKQSANCITRRCSKAQAHKDVALKPFCGQESHQKSKQTCCSLLYTPSAVGFEVCLLLEAQNPLLPGLRETKGPTEGKDMA